MIDKNVTTSSHSAEGEENGLTASSESVRNDDMGNPPIMPVDGEVANLSQSVSLCTEELGPDHLAAF
jgi:hypothetical protein